MAVSVDPLVVGRVIGDVVDMFVPTITMSVYYSSKHVSNDCEIKPSMAINPPRVTINGHPDQLFTLVMTDPDAPSPSEPSMREWVHWSVDESNPRRMYGNPSLYEYTPRKQPSDQILNYPCPNQFFGANIQTPKEQSTIEKQDPSHATRAPLNQHKNT